MGDIEHLLNIQGLDAGVYFPWRSSSNLGKYFHSIREGAAISTRNGKDKTDDAHIYIYK